LVIERNPIITSQLVAFKMNLCTCFFVLAKNNGCVRRNGLSCLVQCKITFICVCYTDFKMFFLLSEILLYKMQIIQF